MLITGTPNDDILSGTGGDDNIIGNDGADLCSGYFGNDILEGGAGIDTLRGGAGSDTLYGGLGRDILNGGEGADVFTFLAQEGSAPAVADRVQDFEVGVDRVLLILTLGGLEDIQHLDPTEFALTGAETEDTRVIYDPTTGRLYLDFDGNGGRWGDHFEPVQIATFDDAPAITAYDIFAG